MPLLLAPADFDLSPDPWSHLLCSGLLLHQSAVVGHDLALGQVEGHLQGHQNGELERDELAPADAEALLQFLQVGKPGKEKQESGSERQ